MSTNKLSIKVCGMRDPQNITQIAQTGIDWMGFIFFPKSKRYVGDNFDATIPNQVQPGIKTLGVFVNESLDAIHKTAQRYQFDLLQLHGDESPAYCQNLKEKGYTLVKAFGVDTDFDFGQLEAYEACIDYFLFDTKSVNYGGTGVQFNWDMLQAYQLARPFLLSGGIGVKDAEQVKQLAHPQLFGIDLNSKFERSPAWKDPKQLSTFLTKLRV